MIDWARVKKEHIRQACRLYDEGKAAPSRQAQNTFLLFEGSRYPAKFIRGLAYKQATGRTLNPSVDYSGGMETVQFFNKMGYDVEYNGELCNGELFIRNGDTVQASSRRTDEGQKERKREKDLQKQALKSQLGRHFGRVETEASFEWLVVPERVSIDNDLMKIVDALSSYRGYKNFFTPGWTLHVDYYIASHKLIIEYDERQHFTIPRAIALRNYPADMKLGFDKDEWINECEKIKANDPTPYNRDETRAFYDSLRDILATRHGLTVKRTKTKDCDWTRPEAGERLKTLLQESTETITALHGAHAIRVREEASNLQRKPGRPTRVVTICVQGDSLQSTAENEEREELLKEAIEHIIGKGWDAIDVVLLPGGFFCFDEYIGSLSYSERVETINKASFNEVCKGCSKLLEKDSPRALIVAGVDGLEKPEGWEGDQLCVAWSIEGIVGIGRKIYPVSGDESDSYICYKHDYETDERIVTLPCGKNAVLCACYDMFGCSEATDDPTRRTDSILNISDNTVLHIYYARKPKHAKDLFKNLRRSCVSDFQNLLRKNNVTVGLAAIHRFRKPGLEGYWRRHGILTCSAALDRGLAVGAAHFVETLPDMNRSTLAVAGIPRIYLSEKPFNKRKDRKYNPIDAFQLRNILVRLFEG